MGEVEAMEHREAFEAGRERCANALSADLHFNLPLELTLPRIEDESDIEYELLLEFAQGKDSFDPTTAAERDWVARLKAHGSAVIAFLAQRAAVDNILFNAYETRATKTSEDDVHSQVAVANAAVLMATRATGDLSKEVDTEVVE